MDNIFALIDTTIVEVKNEMFHASIRDAITKSREVLEMVAENRRKLFLALGYVPATEE